MNRSVGRLRQTSIRMWPSPSRIARARRLMCRPACLFAQFSSHSRRAGLPTLSAVIKEAAAIGRYRVIARRSGPLRAVASRATRPCLRLRQALVSGAFVHDAASAGKPKNRTQHIAATTDFFQRTTPATSRHTLFLFATDNPHMRSENFAGCPVDACGRSRRCDGNFRVGPRAVHVEHAL